MTVPERPVSEEAETLANTLQAVMDQLPTYAARTPDLSIGFGIRLARMVEQLAGMVEQLAGENAALRERVERLAKQVEGLQ